MSEGFGCGRFWTFTSISSRTFETETWAKEMPRSWGGDGQVMVSTVMLVVFSSHFGCWVMPLTFQFAKEIGATKPSGFSKSIRELIYSFSYVCGVNLLLIQLISAKVLKRIQIGLT